MLIHYEKWQFATCTKCRLFLLQKKEEKPAEEPEKTKEQEEEPTKENEINLGIVMIFASFRVFLLISTIFVPLQTSAEIDDEYTTYDSNTYYAVAHNINEKITEQPKILQNGTLKAYQVRRLDSINFTFLLILLRMVLSTWSLFFDSADQWFSNCAAGAKRL